MTYLDRIAEQDKPFKVIRYADHRQEERHCHRYFDSYAEALTYFNSQIGRVTTAVFSTTIAIINVKTGEPVLRQSWRKKEHI
jgi:hypothetical protein